MAGARLGEIPGMREDLIKKASSMALKAHRSPEKLYIVEKTRSSSDAVFSFPGSWSANEWFSGNNPFGETKINLALFPSLRSIGNDEIAKVNEAFLKRFEAILGNSSLKSEVGKALTEKKQIVFTGHSSGGPIAILATVWFLEEYQKPDNNQKSPLCVTFGCPLVGDRIFNHALRRENWSRYFTHFVMRYDIVPRILLAPLSSIERELHQILHFFNPKSTLPAHQSIGDALAFYRNVMRNASTVASHAACRLMGNTNLLLETVSNFIDLSPYTPSGTYVFCTGNGKLIVIRNPDAVLQLLFYSSQLSTEAEGTDIAQRSLREHLNYQNELQETLERQSVVQLGQLEGLPLTSDGADGEGVHVILNDLGLSTRARLCLRAAGELEKQKLTNQAKLDKKKIDIAISTLEAYKSRCEIPKVGYYDAFKISKDNQDFKANVTRLELAGIWDEIIEMLKRYELPDEFENRKEWVELGTRFRRIVEPLDIANYYRHLKNEDTGPYATKGRPRRYRYTQRWREHALRMQPGSSGESLFWAEIEELSRTSNLFEDVKERVLVLERDLKRWVHSGEIGKDVFLEESTFVKWWKTLPHQHKSRSCLLGLMNS